MATPDATAPYGAVRWLCMAMTMRANTANQWADMWVNSEQGDLKFDIFIVLFFLISFLSLNYLNSILAFIKKPNY